MDVRQRFRVSVEIEKEKKIMNVMVKVNAQTENEMVGVQDVFELSGEEILDCATLRSNVISGIGCWVVRSYGTTE